MIYLNDEQKEVVYSDEPFLFVLAGAGTGKTRIIIERIKYLIKSNKVPKSAILGITFTKKASLEMQMRLNEKVDIFTFHSFCLSALKEYGGYHKNIILEEEMDMDREVMLAISKYKNKSLKRKPFFYDEYDSYLKQHNLSDFDDLEIDFLALIKNQKIKSKIQERYRFIFIDEFQDTNNIQYQIIQELIGEKTNVLAVGDPDQSIYAFRGADNQIISRYIADYHAQVITLNTNYRSDESIITLANLIIAQNPYRFKKALVANSKANGLIEIVQFENESEEADFIIDKIRTLNKSGISLSEITILYRNHFRVNCLINRLDNTYIPFQFKDTYGGIGVNLMTIHQAKGLEFVAVFIIGLEQGLLPSLPENRISELYEERRLLFVGITRAKQFLHISCSKLVDGKNSVKSVFFKEIQKIFTKISNKY